MAPQVAAPIPMNAPTSKPLVDGLPPPQQDESGCGLRVMGVVLMKLFWGKKEWGPERGPVSF